MAGSLNKVTLIGNLGQDPQIREMTNGQKVASFSIATSDRWRDKQTNEVKEQTEWHRISIFAPGLVDVCDKLLQKGTKVYIEGSLKTRKYKNQQGMELTSTDVVINPFSGQLIILNGAKSNVSNGELNESSKEVIDAPEIDDEIPF